MAGTAVSRDPATEEEFVASLYKGGELLAANKVVEAREHLEKANKLNPKNEKAQNLLGLAYFKLGLFDQASEVYEALVRENPADPTLRVNLGLVYLKTNNLERSVHEFETATDLEPTHKKAHNYLGLALAQAGDYGRARDHFVAAGSDAMAEKMSKALVARVESEPPVEAMTVLPAPPASAPAIPVEAKVIVSPQAASAESDEELIEVMSDEQEPPSGEMPAVIEAEELAVDVGVDSPSEQNDEVSEPGTTLTELPADAPVELARPSRPNLSATDWGEHAEKQLPAPLEAEVAVEAGDVLDEDQLIEASEEDAAEAAQGPRIEVDQYGEPVTGQQFGRSSKSGLKRVAAAWPESEPRELVSVESMTPEPTAPTDVPVDNSWSAPAPGTDELMASAAQSYVHSGQDEVAPNGEYAEQQATSAENDWSDAATSNAADLEYVPASDAEPQGWAAQPAAGAPPSAEDPRWSSGPAVAAQDAASVQADSGAASETIAGAPYLEQAGEAGSGYALADGDEASSAAYLQQANGGDPDAASAQASGGAAGEPIGNSPYGGGYPDAAYAQANSGAGDETSGNSPYAGGYSDAAYAQVNNGAGGEASGSSPYGGGHSDAAYPQSSRGETSARSAYTGATSAVRAGHSASSDSGAASSTIADAPYLQPDSAQAEGDSEPISDASYLQADDAGASGELPMVDAEPAAAASELDWSGVAATGQAEEPTAAAPAPDAVPDWVASAPDPLAATESAAEPEWVSQPLSEVNFYAAGHESVIAQSEALDRAAISAESAAAVATETARPTVPTYEPRAVSGPVHVDISLTPVTQSPTEPDGVAAIAAPSASAPSGYSPMGSQRLLDLGASTQWVAEGERGPFHLGNDGMAVTVHGEMLVRLTNLVAVVGSVEVSPEMRRIRGRPTDQSFGTGEHQLQRVRGAGVLYLEPGRSLFHAIDLDDEGAYLREERVFAFEEPIAFENGRLTDSGKSVELVNLKGQGRVLLQLDGPLKAMPIPVGSPMVVPLSRLVGWFGRVTPRMVGFVGQGAVELTGEGYALLGAAAERS